MEFMNITWIIATLIGGFIGNRSDAGAIFVFNNVKENIQKNKQFINHDLQKAALRSYYLTLLNLCNEGLKYDSLSKIWYREEIKRINDLLNKIDRNNINEIFMDDIEKIKLFVVSTDIINIKKEIEKEKEKIIKRTLNERYAPEYYIKAVKENMFQKMSVAFAHEIKYNQKISNIFQSQLIANIESHVTEIETNVSVINDKIDSIIEYTINENKEKLGKDILADNRKEYPSNSKFIGRGEILKEIDDKLNLNRIVFLHSIGGMGKTEISKKYLTVYGNKYHTAQFIIYAKEKSLKELIYKINFKNNVDSYFFNNLDIDNPKSEKILFYKLQSLNDLDKGTLLIIDNFDVRPAKQKNDDYEENWTKELLRLISITNNARIIITTRSFFNDFKEFYIEVPALSTKEALKIFNDNCNNNFNIIVTDDIINIIKKFEYNTLLIKLIASLVSSNIKNLTEISNNDLINYNGEIDTIQGHLCTIFDLSQLTKEEVYILTLLLLIQPEGININTFCELVEIKSSISIQNLAYLNWINLYENGTITIHPLIQKLLLPVLKPNYEKCTIFFNNIINKYNQMTDEIEFGNLLKNASIYINDIVFELAYFYYYAGIEYINNDQFKEAKYLFDLSIKCNSEILVNSKIYYYLGIIEWMLEFNYNKSIDYFINQIKIIKKSNFDFLVELYSYISYIYMIHLDYKHLDIYCKILLNLLKNHKKFISNDNYVQGILVVLNRYLLKGEYNYVIDLYEKYLIVDNINDTGVLYILSILYKITKNDYVSRILQNKALFIIENTKEDDILNCCIQSALSETAGILSTEMLYSNRDNNPDLDFLKGFIMMERADRLYKNGNFVDSIKYFNDALDIINSINPNEVNFKPLILLKIANAYNKSGDDINAIKYYNSILKVINKVNNKFIAIDAYISLADYFSNINFNKSYKYYISALKIVESDDLFLDNYMNTLCKKIAFLLLDKGKQDKVQLYMEKANNVSVEKALNNQIDNFIKSAERDLRKNKISSAILFYDKALEDCDNLLLKTDQKLSIYHKMAYICKREAGLIRNNANSYSGYIEKAISYYYECINFIKNSPTYLFTQNERRNEIAKYQMEVGNIYLFLKNVNNEKAILIYTSAINNYNEIINSYSVHDDKLNVKCIRKNLQHTLMMRGKLLADKDNLKAAISDFNDAILQLEFLKANHIQKLNNKNNEFLTIKNEIIKILFMMKDYNKIIDILYELLDPKEGNNTYLINVCEKIEDYLCDTNNIDESDINIIIRILNLKEKILIRNSNNIIQTYLNLANMYKSINNHNKAEETYLIALDDLADNDDNNLLKATIYNSLARLYQNEKDDKKALEYYRKSYPILQDELEDETLVKSIENIIAKLENEIGVS